MEHTDWLGRERGLKAAATNCCMCQRVCSDRSSSSTRPAKAASSPTPDDTCQLYFYGKMSLTSKAFPGVFCHFNSSSSSCCNLQVNHTYNAITSTWQKHWRWQQWTPMHLLPSSSPQSHTLAKVHTAVKNFLSQAHLHSVTVRWREIERIIETGLELWEFVTTASCFSNSCSFSVLSFLPCMAWSIRSSCFQMSSKTAKEKRFCVWFCYCDVQWGIGFWQQQHKFISLVATIHYYYIRLIKWYQNYFTKMYF